MGVNATYLSLLNSECSTCEVVPDKSAYWTPNLYYQRPNGSFEEVVHDGSVIYYLLRGMLPDGSQNVTPFPKGFRMVAGNKSNRRYNATGNTWSKATYPGRPLADAMSFACLSANGVFETYNLVNVSRCVNGLRAQAHLQTCWNGRDLYRTDNTHVAYLSDIDAGVCPPGYPVLLPHLFFETNYAVRLTPNTNDGGRFVFSMGDPTGYGFHADFQNGWDHTIQSLAVKNCLGPQGFGTLQECPVLWANQQSQARWNCPEAATTIMEPSRGVIDKLPGCFRITEGPDSATAADMECPAGVARPQIVSTVDSRPRPTANPAINEKFGNDFNRYLGCFNDSTGAPLRVLNAVLISQPNMTTKYCQTYCNSRGYKFSGTQYGVQCQCDLAVNPTSIFYAGINTTSGCTMTCAGERNVLCGGPAYASLYESTDPNFVPTTDTTNSVLQLSVPLRPLPDTYMGCYTEPSSGRALGTAATNSDKMTPELCASFCSGSKLFGMEFKAECYCGDALANTSALVDGSQCNQRCNGAYDVYCGGNRRVSVYKNPLYRPIVTLPSYGAYTSVGCIADGGALGRTLRGASTTDPNMTVPLCGDYCAARGFAYMGTEYATECYCSNQIDTAVTPGDCETKTKMRCGGDPYTWCGGSGLLNLYLAGS